MCAYISVCLFPYTIINRVFYHILNFSKLIGEKLSR